MEQTISIKVVHFGWQIMLVSIFIVSHQSALMCTKPENWKAQEAFMFLLNY